MTPEEHPTDRVAVAILNAQDELDKALEALAAVPVVEASHVRLVAHTLQNYLTVATGSLFLLERALAAVPPGAVDREVTDAARDPEARHRAHGRRGPVARQRRRRRPGALDLGGHRPGPRPGAPGGLLSIPGRPQGHHPRPGGAARGAAPGLGRPRRRRRRAGESLEQRRQVQPPGGRVWVRLRQDGDTVVVTVADEGPGLSPEDQARLFQRGVRLTPRPTAGEPSSGYGLAVAQQLTDALHGELWCDSVLGQGCAFSLRLPLAGPQGGPPHA